MKSLLLCLLVAGLSAVSAPAAAQSPWRTARVHKAVVVGGSISMYYAGNFGQYLHFGCRDLEVLNRGKVGAGGAALGRLLQESVIGDQALMAGMTKGKAWVLFQGGLNSVARPESTAAWLAKLFRTAHTAGLAVVGLTLTPWGKDGDARFAGWDGVRLHRATEHVSRFILGRLTPKEALGPRAKDRPKEFGEAWAQGELPVLGIDLLHSSLQAGASAPLRPSGPLEATFAASAYAKQGGDKERWLAEARSVPQRFMANQYHDFDHIHPNGAGHRLIAALVCQEAPAGWGCDCDAIRRARWKGKVVAGP